MKQWITFISPPCLLFSSNLWAEQSDNFFNDVIYRVALPEMVVTADRGTLDKNRLDYTRSVRVIDELLISNTSAERVEDIVSYLPGLSPSSSSAGYSTAFSARGFQSRGDVFINSHRDNEQFLIRDFVTIESVEIIKGHGSVLYGSGTPGATLNYISKRPETQAATTLGLIVGSDDFIRTTLDSTGPLGESKSLQYRLVAAGQDGNSSIYRNVEKQRWTIFPSMQWQYSADGSLRLETEYSQDRQPYYFGTIYTQGQILYDKSYVFPQAKADKRYSRVGLYWQHNLDKRLELHTAINRYTTRRDDRLAGFYYKSDESTLVGYYRLVEDDYEQYSVKIDLIGNLATTWATHKLLFGMEHNTNNDEVKSQRNVGGFTLDPFNPDFNIDLSKLPLFTNNYITDNTETGVYLFDQISFSQAWKLEMGTRYSTFDASIKGMDGSYNSDRADKSVWSNSIGVVWRPQEHSSHYFNLSESFKPNWGTDQNNNFFDPRETRQIEAGIRYRLDEGRWNIESAIYQLTQKNLLKRDPEDREYWVLAGERRSQGLEFLLQYLPSQSFSIAASYSFIDAKYIGQDSRNQDNTPASIPKHSGAIRLNYTPLAIPAWRFFSGIKAIDGRFGDDANSFSVPGYALLDLGTHYSRKNLTLSFNITNALDKRYIAASFSDSDIYQGNRRQVRLSVEYRL